MKRVKKLMAAAGLVLCTAAPALADQSKAQVSDQRYHGGKYTSGNAAHVLSNCPREFREMYRGDLYCRNPEYQVLASRHPACPKDAWGMYRGNLYCFGRR